MAEEASTSPTLSKRGARAFEESAHLLGLASFLETQYSNQNPNGVVNFGVAENTLMQDELKADLNANLQLQDLDFTYGDHMCGSTRIFKGLARLFNRYFKPVSPVEPQHIVTGCGVTALIDQVSHLLGDEGDLMLIARPYYNGFNNDVSLRSRCSMHGVDTGSINPDSPQTLAAFESAMSQLESEGKTACAVVLCNPHNPLGFNYRRETLLAYCRFAEKHDLHLVCDEIYALSQFENEKVADKVPFTSILSVDVKREAGCNPARVHVLYGMSKDFCANGLRVGCLVTQHNPDFRNAFVGTALFMKVSSAADALWSRLLLDDTLLDNFVKTNQARLRATIKYCLDWFEARGVPCNQPTTSHFIWLDLRNYLRDRDNDGNEFATDRERDKDLWLAFLEAGIFVAAGYAYTSTLPGHFRFTFCVRRDVLEVGLKRLESVLKARKKT
ncbi:PLP-dependent transferase [Punctularia strigosozonata HHB-11173 SS5]|uniref:PLP-dependent transferase n=1 Tax=Punctularia strigosozonata (strain HHB-11173) TaxID=741275 RepID=R7S3S1_PUNST|nr:PLP-dependent transferase [Punctularia strigosozonata HHB-11173 SS5]EIN03876.1 PLP-dependent transferase [Punctularia strigosozonata HHB-11173 SS5]